MSESLEIYGQSSLQDALWCLLHACLFSGISVPDVPNAKCLIRRPRAPAAMDARLRRLSEAIIRIEEDQEKAVEVPPEAPGFGRAAVEVVADLDTRNEGVNILSDIHKSMVKVHGAAMEEYSKASAERHHSLRTVMGLLAIGVLRVLALLLRVLGSGARHLGKTDTMSISVTTRYVMSAIVAQQHN